MQVTIYPSQVKGQVTIPGSKSLAHRYLIAAALSHGISVIHQVPNNVDVQATVDCIQRLGAIVTLIDDGYQIQGVIPHHHDQLFDVKASGTTLRLLIPILGLDHEPSLITMHPQLANRPLTPYHLIFNDQQLAFQLHNNLLTMQGPLQPGAYQLPGDVSSQFISGLMMALPLLDGPSTIQLTTELQSAPYVELTMQVLRQFNIMVHQINDHLYHIPGQQNYQPGEFTIEADASQAAFFQVLSHINQPIVITNLPASTKQGDGIITTILEYQAQVIDLTHCPDLFPILCVYALTNAQPVTLMGLERLQYKESNRLTSMITIMDLIEADYQLKHHQLTIQPWHGQLTQPITLPTFDDHRIAMAIAILATVSNQPLTINQAQCVNKSYPTFFETLQALSVNLTYGE